MGHPVFAMFTLFSKTILINYTILIQLYEESHKGLKYIIRLPQEGVGVNYHCIYSTYQEPLEDQYWQNTVPIQEVYI